MNLNTMADLYLEWLNDYITIDRFAYDHGMTRADAKNLIKLGRDAHELRVIAYKQLIGGES